MYAADDLVGWRVETENANYCLVQSGQVEAVAESSMDAFFVASAGLYNKHRFTLMRFSHRQPQIFPFSISIFSVILTLEFNCCCAFFSHF